MPSVHSPKGGKSLTFAQIRWSHSSLDTVTMVLFDGKRCYSGTTFNSETMMFKCASFILQSVRPLHRDDIESQEVSYVNVLL